MKNPLWRLKGTKGRGGGAEEIANVQIAFVNVERSKS